MSEPESLVRFQGTWELRGFLSSAEKEIIVVFKVGLVQLPYQRCVP
jgi:hypothetical protein